MVERGRFFGFFLDGADRGAVRESRHRALERLDAPVSIASWYGNSEPPMSLTGPSRAMWFHHEVTVGNRTYGVWSRSVMLDGDDFTKAALVLIDMDPTQARLCETRPRRN